MSGIRSSGFGHRARGRDRLVQVLPPLTFATLCAVPAHAAEWIPSLRIDGRATLTDNYRLAPEGREEAELVLQATPVLGLRREGARAYARVDYAPTLYVYTTNLGDSYTRHRLNGLLNVEAVENFFFVETTARIQDSFFSPFDPGTWDDVADVDNRLQNISFSLSPYIQGALRGGYRYFVRNDNYWTTTDRSSLPGQFDQRLRARLDSPDYRRWSWSADYDYRRAEYEDSPSFYEQEARLIGYYRVNPDLSVNARVGYETNDYTIDSYSGSIYGGGLTWTPTPRTLVSGFAEHRFFGTGYQATLSHRTRITSWRLRASRDTSTYRDQVFSVSAGDTRELLDAVFSARIPDPIEREQAVEDFLISSALPATLDGPLTFYTNRVYLSERVDATAGLFGVRNALTFTLFYRDNEPISELQDDDPVPEVFTIANRLEQWGGVLAFSHNLTVRTAVTASVRRTYSISTEPVVAGFEDIDSTEDVYRLTLNNQLGPRTSAVAGLRWVDFDSERPSSSYQERAVFVGISHRFF
jgi:uncharacterized protein (PEP-CTERM system associated)